MRLVRRREAWSVKDLIASRPTHHAPPFAQAPRSEELGVQVHAAAGNDRLDEHGVPGREGDIDREKPRGGTLSVRGDVVPGRVLAPPAEWEHSRVDRDRVAAFVPEHDGDADRHRCG